MHELDDIALLREYVERDSEEAFAALVTRHIDRVYSVALRHTGNSHQAEEITQAVFVILARKSKHLRKSVILEGWLYQTARLTAVTHIRSEIRRARREQKAHMQNVLNENESDVWSQITPLLDAALAGLNETDRNAVVLRFFYGKSLREIGTTLGANEDTARMRVNRALEKLRQFFLKRGIASTTTTLAGAISANSVHAAPAALAKSITAVAMTKGVAASGSTLTLIKGALKLMAWTKTKTVIVVGVGILLALGTATITIKHIATHKTDESWQVENINSAMVARLTPQVEIRPTKFPFSDNYIMMDGGPHSDKVVGIGVSVADIAWAAYYFSPGRTIFTTPPPPKKYDYVSTKIIKQGASSELQQELKNKLGWVGHRETKDVDVWLLKMQNPNAPGLKPPTDDLDYFTTIDSNDNARSKGVQSLHNFTAFLEKFLGKPVIDQTGQRGAGNLSIDLQWKELGEQDPNHDALKEALRDQLGCELVPGHQPVEMLVMEKMNN
jgi:RNA polymerase sigma factor (sigma-70 family)